MHTKLNINEECTCMCFESYKMLNILLVHFGNSLFHLCKVHVISDCFVPWVEPTICGWRKWCRQKKLSHMLFQVPLHFTYTLDPISNKFLDLFFESRVNRLCNASCLIDIIPIDNI